MRSDRNRSAAGFYLFDRGADRRDSEIITPGRTSAGHHAAHGANSLPAMVEEAIFAQIAHRHELIADPAEQFTIECARRVGLGGAELVPRNALVLGWREDVAC